MKKLIAIALVMVLSLSLLTACGGGNNSGNSGGNTPTPPSNTPSNSTTTPTPPASTPPSETPSGGNSNYSDEEWPDNDYTALIPEPEAGEFLAFSDSQYGAQFLMSWTTDEMMAYVEQAKEAGFTQYPTEMGEGSDYRYTADSDTATITIMSSEISVRMK